MSRDYNKSKFSKFTAPDLVSFIILMVITTIIIITLIIIHLMTKRLLCYLLHCVSYRVVLNDVNFKI